MMRIRVMGVAAVAVIAAWGCKDKDDAAGDGAGAMATISATGEVAVNGTARFVKDGDKVKLTVALTGCPEGLHGFHLHENGSCGDAGNAAGGHWNPENMQHGELGRTDQHHKGDTGNISCAADGTANFEFGTDVWAIGGGAKNDIVGKAVILHAQPDDFGQPTGNAGGRIACGVIEASK